HLCCVDDAVCHRSPSLARLYVEVLADLRILADELAHVLERAVDLVPRLADRDRSETLGRLVGDPGDAGDRCWKLRPQLLERRLRVGKAPEQEPDDHPDAETFASSALMRSSVSCSSWPKSSRKECNAARSSWSSSSVSSIVCMCAP